MTRAELTLEAAAVVARLDERAGEALRRGWREGGADELRELLTAYYRLDAESRAGVRATIAGLTPLRVCARSAK